MVWEWSHSQEAYQAANDNVHKQDREWLEVVYAEWETFDPEEDDSFDQEKYTKALEHAKTLAEDTLADHIWGKMSEQATCENGGLRAWACPYGCGSHLVSFRSKDEDEDEDEDEDDTH